MTPYSPRLWHDEAGQDLVEYTLLIFFSLLAVAVLTGFGSDSIRDIWGSSESNLKAAQEIANGQRPGI